MVVVARSQEAEEQCRPRDAITITIHSGQVPKCAHVGPHGQLGRDHV